MQITNTTAASTIAEYMGGEPTYAEIEAMRQILVEDGRATEDIPEGEWSAMIERAIIRSTLLDAIGESIDRDTIATYRVRDHRAARAECKALADSWGLEYDDSDEDDGSLDAYAWRPDSPDGVHVWRIRIIDDEVAARRLIDACSDLHDGGDTLGVVCRQAVQDDPGATASDVRRIWAEATDEAQA